MAARFMVREGYHDPPIGLNSTLQSAFQSVVLAAPPPPALPRSPQPSPVSGIATPRLGSRGKWPTTRFRRQTATNFPPVADAPSMKPIWRQLNVFRLEL